jgi:hypothetical protein
MLLSKRSNETRLSIKRQIDVNEESSSIKIERKERKNKLSLRVSPVVVRVVLGCSIAVIVIGLSKYLTLLSSTESMAALSFTPQLRLQPAKFRFDWTNMPVTSDLAKRFVATQSNCSIPLAKGELNQYGLGSSLHSYGDRLCATFETRRTWTQLSTKEGPWVWRDVSMCTNDDKSPLQCYFPAAELQCPDDLVTNVDNPVPKIKGLSVCGRLLIIEYSRKILFAATTEYLFRNVSHVVIEEAERQLNVVFPSGKVPKDLIVVHIRWGDKGKEMERVPIWEYLDGVRTILQQRGVSDNRDEPVHIYLATEDRDAVREFKAAVPPNWNVYVDHYFEAMLPYRSSRDEGAFQTNNANAERTKGKSGLIALGSLLVAMEANGFVLTTKSNWSLLMNELRENVMEPRCHGCTLHTNGRPETV